MKPTKFCGHKTGFNSKGSNTTTPNESGPPATKFTGRGATPSGPMKRYPGGAANIDGGNRRLAKTKVSDGDGSGSAFRTNTAFGKSR